MDSSPFVLARIARRSEGKQCRSVTYFFRFYLPSNLVLNKTKSIRIPGSNDQIKKLQLVIGNGIQPNFNVFNQSKKSIFNNISFLFCRIVLVIKHIAHNVAFDNQLQTSVKNTVIK